MLTIENAKEVVRKFADISTYEEMELLAAGLIFTTNPDDAQLESVFWYNMERRLMTAVMAYVRFEMKDPKLETVMDLFRSDKETLDVKFEDVTDRDSAMVRDYELFRHYPEDTKQSIMTGILVRLQVFSLRELFETTAKA